MSVADGVCSAVPLGIRVGGPLGLEAQRRMRRRAIFECGKCDPRVGDTDVLAPWVFVLEAARWGELSRLAEDLAAETLALEGALLARPQLWRGLGLSRALCRALAGAASEPVRGPRLMRFDFHPTAEGWKVSEVNSDVPGGFIEAGGFTRLMAEELAAAGLLTDCFCVPPPDPARAIATALCRAAGASDGVIALVHATAYSDDRSVAECIGAAVRSLGREACAVAPDHLAWRPDGGANLIASGRPVAALHRFFPGEWLDNLPRSAGWRHFFAGSPVPQMNPGAALLTQTKRHPLCWDATDLRLPGWRQLLPETCEPRRALREGLEGWVLKPAWGRVGGGIVMKGVTPEADVRKLRWGARLFPREWVAQRRFQPIAIPTSFGPVFPCFGVYVVEGSVAGIYARASSTPLIGDTAWDAAVLVEQNRGGGA